ncbi:MAG: LSU ribosomal protein L18p (L5e) [uncultured Thiotrichaceae bacterium]|uniref:Large ribosomal subunit protein uL18 n=1 Tax=uncultured Thiotrichaceae bacterium TaxID=298394 RepID=A0A6S6RZ61_9GAMM|nr:MAG: LSU ribosomal protein L18p (L5e) [uncultured Thiotrichaceae bacterium]
MNKKDARIRRGKRARAKMRELGATRLCIHRTSRHIYAQVISADNQKVIATASTLDKEIGADLKCSSNAEAAAAVGKAIAERAKANGVEAVAFDRSGFKYHGRVKALADAARESGLQF